MFHTHWFFVFLPPFLYFITMTAIQLQKEIMQHIQDLSKETLQEVFNYIQVVRLKKNKKDNIEESLAQLDNDELLHIEKEFANYQALYPRE